MLIKISTVFPPYNSLVVLNISDWILAAYLYPYRRTQCGIIDSTVNISDVGIDGFNSIIKLNGSIFWSVIRMQTFYQIKSIN